MLRCGELCLIILIQHYIFGDGELGIGSVVGNKYRIIEHLDSGGFGQVYQGMEVNTGDLVAIKIHQKQKSRYFITNELKYYQYLHGIDGIPKILWYGKQDGSRAIVMELLGDNLETYLFRQNGTLTVSQVSQIAARVLSVLKQVHSRYLLHRDIKPRNIVLASNRIDQNFDDLYLIDFGLSKFYVTPEPSSEQRSSSPQRSHIPFDDHRIHGNFTGSPRFASVSVLIGYEPSRRDDLEALGFTLIHLLRAGLGLWDYDGNYFRTVRDEQTFDVPTNRWKMLQFKLIRTVEELCEGLPVAFRHYLLLVRSLGFYETPNYDLFISLFQPLSVSLSQ